VTAHSTSASVSPMRCRSLVFRFSLFVLLFLAAGALRFTHLNWDQFQHVHPDERFIVWVADSISWPADFASALDPRRSTINPFRWPPGAGDLAGKPRAYSYGHFPLYLLVIVAHTGQTVGEWFGSTTLAFPAAFQPLHVIGRQLTDYNYLPLVGRVISGVSDLGTLLLVFALARRAYGRPPAQRGWIAGLLAAAGYAVAVLPIQLSHFYAVDVVLTFCTIAAMWFAARWAAEATRGESRAFSRWGLWLAAGAMTGLAVGSKFSAVLLIAPLAVAACHGLPAADWTWRSVTVVRRIAIAGGAAAAVFVLTNPFALIEFIAYAANILSQNAMVSGIMDAPYTRQYIGTAAFGYFIQQLSQWGLGWPLGLAAWGGLVWAAIRVGRRRSSPVETVLIAWALPYFALTGGFHAKFLRYMAPLLPFLLVFAAGGALAVCDWLRSRWGRRGGAAWAAAVAAIGVFTVAWALAFTGVYRQEHPWLRASRWIYENVAAENPERGLRTRLLTEHWDDALPLRMDEIPGRPPLREYDRVELPLWDADTPAKLDRLVAALSDADYLILASNRLSAPIQRLPRRYPLTSQYYRLLFTGQLGYRPAAEFTAYPRLGSLVIRDDHADESFTVYDHPTVVIFANTDRLSASLLRARLGRYLPQTLKVSKTSRVSKIPGHARLLPPGQDPTPGAPLTLSQPVDTLPVVADFRWNRFASERPVVAVFVWWLALSIFGCAAWPLLFPLLPGLSDRGYALARTAGWLLLGWVHWLGVSLGLWQNRVGVIAILLTGLAMLAAVAYWVQRRQIAAFCAERGRLLLGEEALFAGAFVAFVGIRLLNPDLWQPWNGGEKFMEFAFLNATLRSAHFPPYDPYFAGGILNYYYFGLYLVSLVVKLTGVAAEVAFNLAVPSLFALTAVGVFAVGYSLAAPKTPKVSKTFRVLETRVLASLLAMVFVLLMGNLAGFGELLRGIAAAGGTLHIADQPIAYLGALARGLAAIAAGAPAAAYDFWSPSRVIPFTINEFPFWTFLFADLHPHMIAMPFGMLVLGVVLSWLKGGRSTGAFLWLALALGSLGAINTWDLPIYFVLVAGTCLLTAWRIGGIVRLAGASVVAAAIGVLALAAYAPFLLNYQAQVGGRTGPLLSRFFGWGHSASPFGPWLLVWGIFIFLAYSFALTEWRRRTENCKLQIADCKSQIADCRLQIADCRLEAADGPETASRPELSEGPQVPVTAASDDVPAIAPEPAPSSLFSAVEGMSEDLPTEPPDGGGQQTLPSESASPDGSDQPVLAAEPGKTLRGAEGSLLPGEEAVTEATAVGGQSSTADAEVVPDPGPQLFHADRLWLLGLLGLLALATLLAVMDRLTAAVLIAPLGLALTFALRRWVSADQAFVAWLMAAGLGVVAGIELFYLRDFLEGGEWYRMNTLFKFSMPAWLFLGLAAGVSLPRIWAAAAGWPDWLRMPWRAATVLLLAAGLTFALAGTPARVQDRFPGPRPAIGTLDGMAFMTVGRFNWPEAENTIEMSYDYLAIQWLLEHVAGTPVVAEAPAGGYELDGQPIGYDYYRAGGLRAGSLTGLPIFVGHHQYEQRPADQVMRRLEQGKEFFATTDFVRTRELIRDLRVAYIYVGVQERILFPAEGLAKFDAMVEAGDLSIAYRNPQVVIYQTQ